MSGTRVLPYKFNKFFWDIDVSNLDIESRSVYIIERLLELGDLDAIKWVRDVYGDEKIVDVVSCSTRIGTRSANYYATLLELPKDRIKCLHKDYQSRHRRIWQH